jgi:hypothetical protein
MRTRDRELDPWGDRLVGLLILGLVLAVPLMWVSAYFGVRPDESLSFFANDGWCDVVTQGVGVHCFGDYRVPVAAALSDAPWSGADAPIPYPAIGMVPYAIAGLLQKTSLGSDGALAMYLIAMCLMMITPAVYVARRFRSWSGRTVTILVLGAAATPLLIIFDRGGDVGFVVPFLLAFALFLDRSPRWVAPTAVIVAAAIRPQYVLLAIAFIAVRRWWSLLASAGGAVAVTLLGFLLWPGSRLANLRQWIEAVVQPHPEIGDPVGGPGPPPASSGPNLSLTRVVARVSGWLGGGEDALGWLRDHSLLPGLLLTILVVAVFLWRGRSVPRAAVVVTVMALPALVPALSFAYYLAFVPPLAAVIIAQPAVPWLGRPEPEGRGLFANAFGTRMRWQIWAGFVLVAIVASMAPLALPVGDGGFAVVLSYTGMLWSIVVIWAAVNAALPDRAGVTESAPA